MNAKQWRKQQVDVAQAAARAAKDALDASVATYGTALPEGLRAALEPLLPYGLSLYRGIPIAARFADGTETETGMLVTGAPAQRAAGEIVALSASRLALPIDVARAAANTMEYRMSSWEPLLVSLGGELRYLVEAHSLFLRHGTFIGQDVNQNVEQRPDVNAHRKGEYEWTDACEKEIVRILCDQL
jgi:hypothetical protein